jgi:hypothetical protein
MGFPLPPPSQEPPERGYRLARAAMQMQWQRAADDIPITQVTHPDEVHEFIDGTPGLADVCHEYPHYLGVYAPQLSIRGFGGQFETAFAELYELSRNRNPNGRCDEQWVLRDPNIGTYDPAGMACDFVQGYGVISGPSATYYDQPEYIAWLLSDRSTFLPDEISSVLTVGMAKWGVWPWTESATGRLEEFGYGRGRFDGQLQLELLGAESTDTFHPSAEAVEDAVHRMTFSARLLGLAEGGEQLAERLVAPDFLGPYFAGRAARRRDR